MESHPGRGDARGVEGGAFGGSARGDHALVRLEEGASEDHRAVLATHEPRVHHRVSKTSGEVCSGCRGRRGETAGFSFDALAKAKVRNDRLNGEGILLTFDPETTEAHCFSREIEGGTLVFEAEGSASRMRDKGTRSVWDAESGRCVSGEMKGRELEEIPAIVSFRKAWMTFHPDSRMIDDPGAADRQRQ